MSASPFTGSQQIFEWPAEWWEAEVSLPPMQRTNAARWNSFLLSLRGRSGTFYLGDSGARTPQGVLSGYPDLLRQTEAFDNAVWNWDGVAGTVTANAQNDPNSNLTAESVVYPTTTTVESYIQQDTGYVPLNGQQYVFSCWVKGPIATTIALRLVQSTGENDNSFTGNVTTGWTRIVSPVQTMVGVGTGTLLVRIGIQPSNAGRTVYLWGAQLDRGSAATTYSGICGGVGPCVAGAGQTGKTLAVNFPIVILQNTVVAKNGDYFQTGTGTSKRLYRLMNDLKLDGSGNATADIFPRLRESPANLQAIYWAWTQGTFRLNSNVNSFDIDEAFIYGSQFGAIEAI